MFDEQSEDQQTYIVLFLLLCQQPADRDHGAEPSIANEHGLQEKETSLARRSRVQMTDDVFYLVLLVAQVIHLALQVASGVEVGIDTSVCKRRRVGL